LAVCLGAGTLSHAVYGQDQKSNADRLAPRSRAELIEMERQKKAATLQPPNPDKAESVFNYIKDHRIIERITTGVGGVRVRFGGMIERSGIALGPEYYRDMLDNQMHFRISARGSVRRYYILDSTLEMPAMADGHAFWSIYAQHFDYPHVDYYGPGPNSAKTGRSGYLLEETSVQAAPGIRPFRHFAIGGMGRFLAVNVSHGRDQEFVSTDKIYTEQTTPGIQFQSNFLQGGGFAEYDWRDNPGGPRSGGLYRAEFSEYSDLTFNRYSFSRANFEVQQYIPLFNQRRVIALRGLLEASDAHAGSRVPFYLQPTLGGADDLRGYRAYRFYDNNAIILNGEYRWEVFSGLDMALFMDAGRVYHDWRNLTLADMREDWGFGFRFNVRNNVFMRLDTGFSSEGFQVWLKFGNVF
jgi:hypothetical protein